MKVLGLRRARVVSGVSRMRRCIRVLRVISKGHTRIIRVIQVSSSGYFGLRA